MEEEIKRFLKWWDKNGDGKFAGESGVISGMGCESVGGCCSDHYDLGGLADELRELIDEPAPPVMVKESDGDGRQG